MAYDVIVVGGGAAGLICAGTAARRGNKVLLVEKMQRPARKILLTGKGRCNVTNNCTREEFLAAVRTNPRFLYSAYHNLSAQDAMALLEEQGVPLKTERGNRVFPVSERSKDIADALVRYVTGGGAEIQQNPVAHLLLQDGRIAGVETVSGEKLYASSVVVATGGKSYPATGSSGDGYALARQVGHTVTPLRASLVPIVTGETWPKEAMGLSLRNVTLTLTRGKKKVFSQLGELLFTHFGISGPLVLSASAHMDGPAKEYQLAIDLKPGLTQEQLDQRLLRDFEEFSNRDFSNGLEKLLPARLIPILVEQSGIPPYTKVHQITREQRETLLSLLKHLPLTPVALGSIEEAVVTAGGVKVQEVDPKTMESKWVKGLYFAGEVLDLDAYTGGFNLQIAYSTGHTAGLFCGKGESI